MEQFLTTKELSARWKINENTLRHWRIDGIGPRFVKMGEGARSSIRYKLKDIAEYEEKNLSK